MKKIILIIISIIILTILGGVFIPLIFVKSFVREERTGNIHYVITDFHITNPKITTLIELEDDTIWAIVSDYERDNFVFWKDTGFNDGEKKQDGFGAIDARFENYTIAEAKKTASQFDLSKENPDAENITGKGEIIDSQENEEIKQLLEATAPENRYFEEIKQRRQEFPNYNPDRKIEDFFSLKKGDGFFEIRDSVGFGEQGESDGQATSLYEDKYLIDKDGINFIALGFNENLTKINRGNAEINENARLEKIVIVTSDRRFIEVKAKSDSTFNFDSALNEIK